MRALFLILSLFLAFPAFAAEPVAFKIVPEESHISFEVKQENKLIKGRFTKFDGTIDFHPEALAKSKAEIAIDMASVTLDDSQAQGMVAKEEWLSTTAFPKAIFRAVSFRKLPTGSYEATGNLTIKDVTIGIVLAFTLDAFKPDAAAITGDATLHRKDFKIGWDDTASVADEVKVTVAVKAIAK